MQLEDWLDDLCVRFIINLPPEELESVERICFQVEEAQWFYEDFIRPLDPSLPSLTLRAFSLKIFQHCPLFSQWDVQHYTTAFAEFLAYKSRVPVRGAIMLNEAMDQVVLVKGWKKGANWSFPRGKINKDEDDLDCAIREVYEETGYDIKKAGLVKGEQESKYIEVNMREQNMRLYVFRGVPMDTHFEPRTRKEISKIEWYKLTDLPTAKKNKYQEVVNENLPTNANKFYMVAPFLVPLKKWIAQQRKKDSQRNSEGHLAPPAVYEEIVTEDEPDMANGDERPPLQPVRSYGPSDLPEVSVAQPYQSDPSSQLKQLLNIHDSIPPPQEMSYKSTSLSQSAEPNANALLALLRQGSTVQPEPLPHTPLNQLSFPPEVPRSPHPTHPRPPPFSTQPPPQFPFRPVRHHTLQSHFQVQPPTLPSQEERVTFIPTQTVDQSSIDDPSFTRTHQQQPSAPYRQTGDPHFARQSVHDQQISSIPPASALPKLTNHTRALLDVFKTSDPTQIPLTSLPFPTHMSSTSTRPATQTEHRSSNTSILEAVASNPVKPGYPGIPITDIMEVNLPTTRRPKSEHQTSLLDLFRKPHQAETVTGIAMITSSLRPGPVELSAQRTPGLDEKSTTSYDNVKHSIQREREEPTNNRDTTKVGRLGKREGQTSATVSGPLNQPQFENIAHTPRKTTNPDDFARSPKPAARTLFDPKQPPAVKILARPEEAKHTPARSPRAPKSTPSTALKSAPRSTESARPNPPTILRRPQKEDLRENGQLESHDLPPKAPMQTGQRLAPSDQILPSRSLISDVQQDPLPAQVHSAESLSMKTSTSSRPGLPDDSHRQSLLSLFNKPPVPQGVTPISQQPLRTESPLTASQVVSPMNEKQVNGMGTISTRSRMGSIASAVSGPSQALSEKRQTTAGDRAFLLGYLGRIASQEG